MTIKTVLILLSIILLFLQALDVKSQRVPISLGWLGLAVLACALLLPNTFG